jgi:hypothetical protein
VDDVVEPGSFAVHPPSMAVSPTCRRTGWRPPARADGPFGRPPRLHPDDSACRPATAR